MSFSYLTADSGRKVAGFWGLVISYYGLHPLNAAIPYGELKVPVTELYAIHQPPS